MATAHQRIGWVAGFAGLMALAGFTAHATIASHADAPLPPLSATIPQAQLSAPARGTTGTTTLPDLPVPETAALTTGTPAAQPFRLRGSTLDQSRALQCLTTAIYYEAASEPDAGQRAVAQVVLNRVRHPAFPATVCGVVFQGSDKRGCQFSFACDGSMARTPMRRYWDRAQRVAAAALNGQVFAPVGLATHYHTYAVTPAWNRSLVMTDAQGAHFFHRWKGWWGTPAAFQDRHAGGEPQPGPLGAVAHVAAAEASVMPIPVPPPAAAPVAPTAPVLSQVQAPYADSGTALVPLSGESQILDKWKDSGRPIR
ncbi:cell wall hydrolase [Sphingomonas sp.]|uniref:cell wall hydrolase n=1 Tax=Sphingomonas sp. TaxID=28214 RepID=UPI002BCF2585|nr:cell wall hydrolase [Sphingomonas sp.]HTG38748.1 cell wall hydrolase [Sphingomonas sp.]